MLIPFQPGQRVRIEKFESALTNARMNKFRSTLPNDAEAIVIECTTDYSYENESDIPDIQKATDLWAYSLCIVKHGKLTGEGGAWYPHNQLTLIEDVNAANLLLWFQGKDLH